MQQCQYRQPYGAGDRIFKKCELKFIVYVPLIRHGPHKNAFNNSSLSREESLPSSYLATVKETHKTHRNTQSNNSAVAFIRCCRNVFTEPLPSNGKGTQTHMTEGKDL
jgi:hypothetical protein